MNLQEHLPGIQNLLKYLFIGSSDEDDRNILDGRVDMAPQRHWLATQNGENQCVVVLKSQRLLLTSFIQ